MGGFIKNRQCWYFIFKKLRPMFRRQQPVASESVLSCTSIGGQKGLEPLMVLYGQSRVLILLLAAWNPSTQISMTLAKDPVELSLKLEYGCRHQILQHQAVRAASKGWQWQLRRGKQIVHCLLSPTETPLGGAGNVAGVPAFHFLCLSVFFSFIDLAGH